MTAQERQEAWREVGEMLRHAGGHGASAGSHVQLALRGDNPSYFSEGHAIEKAQWAAACANRALDLLDQLRGE